MEPDVQTEDLAHCKVSPSPHRVQQDALFISDEVSEFSRDLDERDPFRLDNDLDLHLGISLEDSDGAPRKSITKDQETKASSTWHPFFLQRRIIYLFIAVFISLPIVLELLLMVSEKRQGLTTISPDAPSAWKYVPAVVATILSAACSCIDFSARVTAPWILAQKGTDIAKSFLMDYLSVSQILVPIRALKSRNALVATLSLISLLSSVLMVFAPSLIRVVTLEVSIPIELSTQFVDNPSGLREPNLIPLYNAIGLKRHNLTSPLGVQGQYVFQSFNPSPTTASRLRTEVDSLSFELDCEEAVLTSFTVNSQHDSNDSTVTFVVQFVDCNITLRVDFDPFLMITQPQPKSKELSTTTCVSRVVDGMCTANASHPSRYRLFWMLAELVQTINFTTSLNASFENPYVVSESDLSTATFSLQQNTGLACQPVYRLSKMDVVKEENSPYQLSFSADGPPRTLANVHGWEFVKSMLGAFDSKHYHSTLLTNVVHTVSFSDSDIGLELETDGGFDFDYLSNVILGLDQSSYPGDRALFNYSSLVSSIQSYYQVHCAFLAQRDLMEKTTGQSAPGFAAIVQGRLMVQALPCHVLACTCLLSALLLVPTLLVLPPHPSLPGDSRTISGLMVLARHFARRFPKGLGFATVPELKAAIIQWDTRNHSQEGTELDCGPGSGGPDQPFLSRPQNPRPKLTFKRRPVSHKATFHHPLILRASLRLPVLALITGILALLELLLRKSIQEDGIGLAHSQTYLRYLWTLLPTLVLASLGLFFCAVDSEVRTLSPYLALSSGTGSYHRSMALNFRGQLDPRVIWKELHTRHFGAAAATITAILANLLTVSSGSLFFETITPVIRNQGLRLIGSFSSEMYNEDFMAVFGAHSGGVMGVNTFGILATLVLQSNLSFPAHTMHGLAFPVLELQESSGYNPHMDKNPQDTESSARIRAVVPALRGGLACHVHPPGDIFSDIILNATNPRQPLLRINVTGEFCPYDPTEPEISVTHYEQLDISDSPEGFLGWATNILNHCSEYMYIWGTYSYAPEKATPSVSVLAALSCNGTIETVDVDTTFIGAADMAISIEEAPRPLEQTKQVVIPGNHAQSLGGVYQDMYAPVMDNATQLDTFFTLLVTSLYAIPLSALSDPSQVPTVIDAIQRQHAMIFAQALSTTCRVPTSDNPDPYGRDAGVLASVGKGSVNSTIYNATVTNSNQGQQRVFQDETSTRITQGLLGLTLVFAILSWKLTPGADKLLTRPPTSVASVLALLVDGNVYTETFGKGGGKRTSLVGMTDGEIRKRFGTKPVFSLGMGLVRGKKIDDLEVSGEEDGREVESSDADVRLDQRFGIWVEGGL